MEEDESEALAAALCRSPARRSTEAFDAAPAPVVNDADTGMDPVSEEAHLREIWRELGVGTSGYINVDELARVCDHIGMDEMSDDVSRVVDDITVCLLHSVVLFSAQELAHLFDKLDVDQDGLVSFSEFLRGLFQHGNTPAATPISTQRCELTKPCSSHSIIDHDIDLLFLSSAE